MNERKGSLVNMIEMDEPLFDGRSQNCVLSTENERHTASSARPCRGLDPITSGRRCERRHGQKVRNGTREVLAGLTEEVREEPSYKETKAEEAGTMTDG